MFIDSRTLPHGTVVEADICIIGAGSAGITIAREFIDKSFKVVLLESGGLTADPATQSLYAGENAGIPYAALESTRSRYFGGSTNCWVGWCRPFDRIDFEYRDWVANSGWPLDHSALAPYFLRAHDVLQLTELRFDADSWRERLKREALDFLPLRDGGIKNQINLFSPPTRFGDAYRDLLRNAADVQTFLNANVVEIEANETASAVERVRVATLQGNQFAVSARAFVLAAGGIENARLLLLSNRVQPAGLGNGSDLVGRYFMEHPRLRGRKIRLKNPGRHRRLYDSTLVMSRRRLNTRALRLGVDLAPTEASQRRLGLQNSRTYLSAIYRGDGSAEIETLRRTHQLFKDRRKYGYSAAYLANDVLRNLPRLTARLPQLASSVFDYTANPNHAGREFWLDTIIEPAPNPDSRVVLSGEKDALGLNRSRVELRLSDSDRQTFVGTQELLAAELGASGAVEFDDAPAPDWPEKVFWCSHHMGTTRMDEDARKGIVDKNCRVHGIGNLFVAGSSVFPTGGSDIPTMTIVAMALRLSDHLLAAMARPAAAPPERVRDRAAFRLVTAG